MKITDRDIDLFRWINSHGFIFTTHAARWMGVGYETARARIAKYREAGLVRAQKKVSGLSQLLYLTQKSWRLTEDSLPLMFISNRLQTFNHDVQLIDLDLTLRDLYPGCLFISERWIRHNKDINRTDHVPDGFLMLKDSTRTIAIELELSQKKRARLKAIIRSYQTTFEYEQVWYFTAPKLTQTLLELTANDPLFVVREVTPNPCL